MRRRPTAGSKTSPPRTIPEWFAKSRGRAPGTALPVAGSGPAGWARVASSGFPVDGRGHGNQRQVHALEGLGMTREEVPAGHELVRQFLEDADLRRPVE